MSDSKFKLVYVVCPRCKEVARACGRYALCYGCGYNIPVKEQGRAK